MSQNNPLANRIERLEIDNPAEDPQWPHLRCDLNDAWGMAESSSFGGRNAIRLVPANYTADWADTVPELLTKVVALLVEKRKQELRFNLLQVTLVDFEKRIQRLESFQTNIVPIDSFAPEPYDLLKTILVSVNSVEGGFSAGWFDANIHFSGDNEEDAVNNLKGLILDFFESFSSEPPDKLGPEPTRQLAVMKEYIRKKP